MTLISGDGIGVFEAVHGSAPGITSQDAANPIALLLSAVFMLHHIGESAIADRIVGPLGQVLSEGPIRTQDLGDSATTSAFADPLVEVEKVVAT